MEVNNSEVLNTLPTIFFWQNFIIYLFVWPFVPNNEYLPTSGPGYLTLTFSDMHIIPFHWKNYGLLAEFMAAKMHFVLCLVLWWTWPQILESQIFRNVEQFSCKSSWLTKAYPGTFHPNCNYTIFGHTDTLVFVL